MTDYEDRLEKELKTAKLVQDGAMPREIPEIDGLHIATYFHPANFIGGDFLRLDGNKERNKLDILIGDVCGKGVPAALIMAVVYCLFKEKSKITQNPSELMAGVNVSLKEFLGAGSYFNSTAIWGEFDLDKMIFSYADAGHDFPFHFSKANNSVEELPSTGTLLGIFKESKYETKNITINHGDYLLFYSDGLIDFFEAYASCDNGYRFLKDFLKTRINIDPTNIADELKLLVENNIKFATDDITVIIVKVD